MMLYKSSLLRQISWEQIIVVDLAQLIVRVILPMPFSDPANKSWTAEKIKEIHPRTVLDVGAGAGVYLDIIRKNLDQDVNVVGVEIGNLTLKSSI